jgi:DNA-directed RNA polymerase subunit RPC12/RpoP
MVIYYMEVFFMQARCMMCGRPVELEEFKVDPYDDYDEEIKKKSPVVFCQMCEAKIRHESDESQKLPKPV